MRYGMILSMCDYDYAALIKPVLEPIGARM